MNRLVKISGIVIFSVFAIVSLSLIVLGIINLKDSSSQSNQDIPEIKITYDNMEYILSQNSIVQDLPSDGVLLLKFYNFNSGERQWEKSYVIKKGSVKEGSENADVTISLNSRYLGTLTTRNFCEIIQLAKANNDVMFDTSISTTALAWKYRGVIKYKSCFGM